MDRCRSKYGIKLYQAKAWGVGGEQVQPALEKARKTFAESHQKLVASPANTQQIKDGLELVNQQWFFFENALGQRLALISVRRLMLQPAM